MTRPLLDSPSRGRSRVCGLSYPERRSTDFVRWPRMPGFSFRPWESVRLPQVITGVALAIGLPLFLQTPVWCDITLYDVAARNLLRGGVHYRDVFDTNLPGFVWLLTAICWTFGFSSIALRSVDLAIVAGIVTLIDRLARRGGATPVSRWWAIAAVAVLYPSTVEMVHAQRDTWMALPIVAALLIRVRCGSESMPSTARHVCLGWPGRRFVGVRGLDQTALCFDGGGRLAGDGLAAREQCDSPSRRASGRCPGQPDGWARGRTGRDRARGREWFLVRILGSPHHLGARIRGPLPPRARHALRPGTVLVPALEPPPHPHRAARVPFLPRCRAMGRPVLATGRAAGTDWPPASRLVVGPEAGDRARFARSARQYFIWSGQRSRSTSSAALSTVTSSNSS